MPVVLPHCDNILSEGIILLCVWHPTPVVERDTWNKAGHEAEYEAVHEAEYECCE